MPKKSKKQKTKRKKPVRKKPVRKKKKNRKHPTRRASRIKWPEEEAEKLTAKGRQRNFVTEDELFYAFPRIEKYVDQYEEFLDHLEKLGIQVTPSRQEYLRKPEGEEKEFLFDVKSNSAKSVEIKHEINVEDIELPNIDDFDKARRLAKRVGTIHRFVSLDGSEFKETKINFKV